MKRRWVIFSIIGLGVMLLLTLLLTPTQSTVSQGSSYGRNSRDYGAWYQWMTSQGIEIQQWRKPFDELPTDQNYTLIQVYPSLKDHFAKNQQDWLRKGNHLVILGKKYPVTHAPFKSEHQTPSGKVIIETTRRNQKATQPLLEDEFGTIVWRDTIGKGEVIIATLPDLAANAYQKSVGNYQFLKALVTKADYPILIDEYLHGYRDQETLNKEVGANIWSYLRKTSLFPVFIQGCVLFALMLWATNRRFGRLQTVETPKVNNSQSYITATAQVLAKAESHQFVIKMITEDEKRKLSEQLAIKLTDSESIKSLIAAWSQETGQSSDTLQSQLTFAQKKPHLSRSQFKQWLEKWIKL